MASPTPLSNFSSAVDAYCAWINSPAETPLQDALRGHQALTGVCHFILPVLDLNVEDDSRPGELQVEYPSRDMLYQRLEILPVQDFSFLRTPLDAPFGEVLTANLSDDLLDIFYDLYEGACLLKQSGDGAAVKHWRTLYHERWGRQAVRASAALFAYLDKE